MMNVSVIKTKLGKQSEFVALVLVNSSEYYKASTSLIKFLTTTKNIPGVYLSVNKPFSVLNESFKKEGIRTDIIIFIDAITSLSDGKIEENEHCYYLESPENLSDISIAISEAIESIDHKEKFIFIDSLSTLLVYNNPDTVTKFIHFLVGKMRAWNATGVILSLKKRGEGSLIAEIGQFCDMTIEL